MYYTTTRKLLCSVYTDLLEQYKPSLPDDEDLEGVIAALLRLQDTYQLTSQQIADGTFTPTNRSPPLSGRSIGTTCHG